MPIAKIIPLRKFQKQHDIFDYLIPNELLPKIRIGQLVAMEFKKSLIQGLVTGITAKSELPFGKLKPLSEILVEKPLLTEKYLKLISDLAKYYFVSPSLFLNSILPVKPLKKHRSKSAKIFQNIEFNNCHNLKKIKIPEKPGRPILFKYFKEKDKISLYLDLIENALLKNGQILIVFPEKTDIKNFLPYLNNWQQETEVFDDKNKNQYFNQWRSIQNNTKKIILGTRSAVFCPLAKAEFIVIDQENDPSHKQEEPNPRYDTRYVANKLAELYDCRLIFSSYCPSLKTYYQTQIKNFDLQEQPIKTFNWEIIDQKTEIKKGNFSSLSEKLQLILEKNSKKKRKTFLFNTKKGYAKVVQCEDCQAILYCPDCRLPISYHQDGQNLVCHYCDYQAAMAATCPTCRGPKLKLKGLGSEKLKKEILKILPRVKILELNLDTFPEKEKIEIDDYEIVIGTNYSFKLIDWAKIDFLGIVNPDSLFHLADYRADERAFQELSNLVHFYRRENILLQTFATDHRVIRLLKNFNYPEFFKREIIDRQKFKYPPFYKIIKITYKAPNQEKGEITMAQKYDQLIGVFKDYPKIILSGPIRSYRQKIRQYFPMHIILKYPAAEHALFESVRNILEKNIPADWIIDHEPSRLD